MSAHEPAGGLEARARAAGLALERGVSLARFTTLELGGPARWLVRAHDEATVARALAWAQAGGVPVLILGGGSNLVVADAGFDGLAIAMGLRGREFRAQGNLVECSVAAGEPWDAVVADSVARGLSGIECLSGIPGLAGATPIQNVGAYGQEVGAAVVGVRVLERPSLAPRMLDAAACDFGYRDSLFKRQPDRFVVLGLTLALSRGPAAPPRYPELARRLGAAPVAVAQVREAVLAIRSEKSMVLRPDDENRRSVGSFFLNPVVPEARAAAVVARALAAGHARAADEVPRFPAGPGQVKLAAAWLIEHAGFVRGYREGAVGLSSRHALALVHHGGGSTAALIALARALRDAVEARFGVRLEPEARLVGASL